MAKLERTYRRKFAVHKTPKDYHREDDKEEVDKELQMWFDEWLAIVESDAVDIPDHIKDSAQFYEWIMSDDTGEEQNDN